ncbi:N-acetylmuramoyl-L-alanine amidase [Succinivibrio dextrinosolvens]|uniref:N-acetylmuramoyl-L-alanine amidase n=1 Tax=Succinivibrio dextrinosolvens TaxID=83771 RepID=A0A662ZD86_9GAMM|nr:N-acetylmuramoyl-L-alanine amidase [Succinivibrio dextrinosolvens]SFK29577.1 N-acetylmuramoyl-L-alanine amidase [Succinivibrio dextrinosolvens]
MCLLIPEVAYSQEVYKLRNYHNSEKTRVVLDTESKPDFSTALSKDKSVMAVRIRNIDNLSKAPKGGKFKPQSCLSSVAKKTDGRDVRYIFSLKSCETPKTFILAPSKDSKNYRLVIDFPHGMAVSSLSSDNKAQIKSTETRSSPVNSAKTSGVDTSKSLAAQERDLFIQYSAAGKDGFRTMTPANAAIYNQKLKELRENYKKAQLEQDATIAAERQSSAVKKSSSSRIEVEEEVADTSAPPVPVNATPVARPFIIAIDAGHGGKDPGAIGKRGVREKNVTLAISKALVSYINSNKSFRGTLIRSSDIFIDLDRRSEIARKRKADLLISIHADSVASGNSTARGASVLVLSENRAERENGKILKNHKQTQLIGGAGEVMDQSVGNPYLATAILDMSSTNSRSEGNLLAKEILRSLGSFTHLRKSQPISASLAVLKSPDIPSLLIETGYLSNRYEEIQLNQPNYQKQIAYHIYLGIKSYYEKYPAQKIKSRQESYARTKKMGGKRSITVKKGESLSIIANRYGTTVSEIKKLNSLKKDTLSVGQVLYLP